MVARVWPCVRELVVNSVVEDSKKFYFLKAKLCTFTLPHLIFSVLLLSTKLIFDLLSHVIAATVIKSTLLINSSSKISILGYFVQNIAILHFLHTAQP